MIEELIASIREKQKDSLNSYDARSVEIGELSQRKAELESHLGELCDERNGLALSKKNRVLNYFYQRFSKKYQQASERNQAIDAEIQPSNTTLADISGRLKTLEAENAALDRNGISDEIERMQNDSYCIARLVDSNPKLVNDVQFMGELIERDVSYIQYDNTNSPEIYQRIINKAIDVLNDKARNDSEYQDSATFKIYKKSEPALLRVMDQIPVAEDKYNIPQKYLFELIRTHFLVPEKSDFESAKSLLYKISSNYLDKQGKYSKEYGEIIERLYENKDTVMLIHNMTHQMAASPEAVETRKNHIFRKGLQSSCGGVTHLSCCETTTIGKKPDQQYFLNMFAAGPTRIIMLVPREAFIDGESAIPIWGADTITANITNLTHILPEFVVGASIETDSFQRNPIPLSDRKQYPYVFKEESIHGSPVTTLDVGVKK